MTKRTDGGVTHPRANDWKPHGARLPGFVVEEDIGLGDAIKRAVSYFGVRSCGGCERRRVALNRWMTFSGGPHKIRELRIGAPNV